MIPSVLIEKARPEQVRGIQDVYYRTWLDTYVSPEYGITREDIEDRFKDSLSKETLRARAKSIEEPLAEQRYFVALVEGKVVGVARAERESEVNRIRTLYVLPEYQGQGIGRMLWEEIERFLDSTKDTEVNVATFNARAIAFYKKHGFVDTGERFTRERFRFKSGAILPELKMVRSAA